jgi:hypothetical protein
MFTKISCVSFIWLDKKINAYNIFTQFFSSDLDISQNHERFYENEDTVLAQIVISLPNLKALDISGTNLAGKGKLFELW